MLFLFGNEVSCSGLGTGLESPPLTCGEGRAPAFFPLHFHCTITVGDGGMSIPPTGRRLGRGKRSEEERSAGKYKTIDVPM